MPSRNAERELTLDQFLDKYLDDFARDGYREEWRAYLVARWNWIQSQSKDDWKLAIEAYKLVPNRPNKIFP